MRQWTLTCCRLQLTKQRDSQKDIIQVVITNVVDSAFGFLAFTRLARERASKLMSSWPVDYLGHLPQTKGKYE